MNEERKEISIKEFVEEGYLQEVNRQFLHPHGLALAVGRMPDGSYVLSGVWDSRADLEGFYFDKAIDLAPKAENIEKLKQERWTPRVMEVGSWVQPVEAFDHHAYIKKMQGDWVKPEDGK